MRRTRPRMILTATAIAVLSAIAAGIFVHRTSAPPPVVDVGRRAPATQATLTRVAGRYDAVLRSVAKLAGSDEQFFALEARGHLDLRGTSGAKPALALRFEGGFSELEGSAVENLSTGQRADLDRQLKSPIFAQYEPSGAFRGLQVSRGQSDLVLQVQRFMAGILQLSDGHGETWEAAERDATGRYLASYERCGPGCVTRKKLRYTEPLPDRASVQVKQSETTFRFDTTSLAELSCHDLVQTQALGAMTFVVDTTFTLRKAEPLDTPLPSPATDVVDVGVDGSATPLDRDELLIGGRSAKTVMARLAEFKEASEKTRLSPEQRAEEGREYLAMKALLRKDAGTVTAARDHVLARGKLSDDLIATLRDAGNPESQAALREIMTTSAAPPQTRFEATRALSLVDKPSRESIAALEAARGDEKLRQQATYGLGSAAYRSRTSDPSLASQALSSLLDMLSREADPYRLATILKALGNAGMAEALPAIAKCLTSPSAIVRRSAAESLRRIEGPESDALLLRALGDPADDVRSEAARALGEHRPNETILAAVVVTAQRDTEPRVRIQAVLALVNWARSGAPTLGTLEAIANNDPNQRVRELAAGALPGLAKL